MYIYMNICIYINESAPRGKIEMTPILISKCREGTRTMVCNG